MNNKCNTKQIFCFWLISPLVAGVLAGCHANTAGKGEVPRVVTPTSSSSSSSGGSQFAGSRSCRDCHEHFYEIWSTSWHGLAMQPFTAEFARKELTGEHSSVTIGKRSYRAEVAEGSGRVRETGPQGERTYPIVHVMGGKNVYYFLTSLEKGRLQVLPIAYDVHKKTWYDTAASGVRHFPDRRDEALDWTDRMFTFNTTCFNCHVSQLATNYDLKTDTYHTTWSESGISCESCHGPAVEHLKAMEAGAQGHSSKEIKIIRTNDFTTVQMNDMCATCHAKMIPISTSFQPGDAFFDHFDLVTLEHPDFYPDGRDLGENYTHSSWLQSPCVKGGQLDCNHCHTPSGRPRFEGMAANQSCLPCHDAHVKDPAAHGHHPEGSKGNDCLACHMPMTRFAAMNRTDHSMRPPAPAATLAIGSPNACNLCHNEKDAAWADDWVRKWYPRDFQAAILGPARLLDAARKNEWKQLPEMLALLAKPETGPIWKASLARLLRGTSSPSKWSALRQLLADDSPLVRSAAASVLGEPLTIDVVPDLLAATRDESRLVRIRAAQSLAALPPNSVTGDRDRQSLERAVTEFQTAMGARPDDWASHANLGNFHMERGAVREALQQFEIATSIEPRVIGPLVNAALIYNQLNQNDRAEDSLRRALKSEPRNASAQFNLGLLLGEQGRTEEAEQALRIALKADPRLAAAAYNLGVIVSQKNLDEAVQLCRKARELEPDDQKYALTLAFYQRQKGDRAGAYVTLQHWLAQHPLDGEAYLSLGQLSVEQGDSKSAERLYREALGKQGLPPAQRAQIEARLRKLGEAPNGSPGR